MARASRVSVHIDARAVPLLPHVLELIERDVVPGGTRDNAAVHAEFVSYEDAVRYEVRMALSDAQTSGGLLVSLAPNRLAAFQREMQGARALCAVIGEVRTGEGIVVY
jgi:selenide,water dikinase